MSITPVYLSIKTLDFSCSAGLPRGVYVAVHPTRDFVVADMGRILDMLQRIAPSIIDRLFLQVDFTAQLTGEPKSADAPDTLYAVVSGYDTGEGDFSKFSVLSVAHKKYICY